MDAIPKKLFAFDLDGTLLRSNKSISDRTLDAIDKMVAKGYLISIATARPPRDVTRLLPDTLFRHYAICYNGAEVYKGSSQIFAQHILPDIANKLISELIKYYPYLFIGIESRDTFHVNQSPVHLFGEVDHLYMTFGDSQQPIFKDGIAKIIYEGAVTGAEPFMFDFLNDACTVIHTDNGSIVQIMDHGVSKWTALQRIAHDEGIALQDIIAFGDDHNDLAMLTSCGMGVAMANASPAVLAASSYVTASNDEDGVAMFLEANFL